MHKLGDSSLLLHFVQDKSQNDGLNNYKTFSFEIMNTIDLILFILIGAVGFVLGMLINQLINNWTNKDQPIKPEAKQDVLLTISRNPKSGQLMVSVAGKKATRSDRLTKKEQETTQDLITELNAHLRSTNLPKIEKRDLSINKEKPGAETMDESISKPSLNPVTALVRALQADVKKSELPTISIVTQINDILQEDLRNAPHIHDPVCLMEWPGKGMIVMVGLEKYDTVDDVPDEDIQDIIHGAVKKWENKTMKEQT